MWAVVASWDASNGLHRTTEGGFIVEIIMQASKLCSRLLELERRRFQGGKKNIQVLRKGMMSSLPGKQLLRYILIRENAWRPWSASYSHHVVDAEMAALITS